MRRPATPTASCPERGSFWRLVWAELARLVCRLRALLTIAGLTGLGGYVIDRKELPDHFWDAFKHSLPVGTLIAGMVVAAGSLAEDRRTRHARMILLRGYPRRSYAWAKALAVAGSTGLVTFVGLVGFVLAARLRLPLEIWTRPLLPDLLPLAVLTVNAAGLALMGFCAGTLTDNEYLASAAPFLIIVISVLMLDHALYSPAMHLDAWRDLEGVRGRPPRFPELDPFLYWLVLGSLLSLLGAELFARSEKD